MSFLTRKSFLLTLCGLLIIGAVFAVSFSGDRIEYGEADQSVDVFKRAQQVATAAAAKQDTDGDGLLDWEETLWNTDLENPDTDGDATSDGDEVDAGRNPAAPGPEDKFEVSESGHIKLPGEEERPTETEKLAGDFFTKYLTLRKAGQLETVTAQEELFGILTQPFGAPTISPTEFTLDDILVGPQRGESAAKGYGNVVGAVIARNSIQNENEAKILLRALENDNPEELHDLEHIEEAYAGMVRDLGAVVAPQDAGEVHLDLVNSLATMEHTINDMQQAFTDPVVMLAAIQGYQEDAGALLDALIQAQNYLRSNGVTYSAEEPGNLLMTIVTAQ